MKRKRSNCDSASRGTGSSNPSPSSRESCANCFLESGPKTPTCQGQPRAEAYLNRGAESGSPPLRIDSRDLFAPVTWHELVPEPWSGTAFSLVQSRKMALPAEPMSPSISRFDPAWRRCRLDRAIARHCNRTGYETIARMR
jgi:hypothetical protein